MKRNFRNPPKVQLLGGFHADSEVSFYIAASCVSIPFASSSNLSDPA